MTRLECIKSNAFLLGLNMNKATKEQKIQWLCQIIDNETDKPEDETDFALIGECSAYLRELSDKAAEATKEQKRRILQQIKAHHNQTATRSAKVLRPNWKTTRKVVAIAIAAALLLTLTLSVIAKVKGYSSAWEYVKDNLQKIASMDCGDRVREGNITLTKHDGVVTYNSIEELLQEEGYDIMYPSVLPEGVRITNISQAIVTVDYYIYSIQFTDDRISIIVSNGREISFDDVNKYEKHETEGIQFYIEKVSEDFCQATGYDGTYEYTICCDDYDQLIVILNGMKGIGK
jgi:hypothetical protein